MGSLKWAVLFMVVFCVGLQNATDLQVGSSNGQLVHNENVKLSPIPFSTRVKNVFYNDNSTRIIKGIWVVDLDKSDAKVSLTAGGVGFLYVNVKIKSQKGDALNFLVQIFV